MNKKGQSLVVFVIIMPFLLLLLLTISDIGNLVITQNKYETEIKRAIKYGLKHKEDAKVLEKINTLLNYTIKEEKNISIDNENIEITIAKKNKIMGVNFDSNLSFTGHKEDEKIIINRR